MEGRGGSDSPALTPRFSTACATTGRAPPRSKSRGRSCAEPPSVFRQTPSLRGPARPCDVTSKVDPERVALLVQSEWRLCYVTPLYRFRYTQLRLYSRHLAAFIQAEKRQGVAVEVGLEAGFQVTVSAVPGLAETEDDAETVFIQIHSKPAFSADAPKPAWHGWLTCVNGDPAHLRSLPPDFVSLPLFCSNGSESLTALVKSWFGRAFDCSFGSLGLSPTTLRWLAALWTGCQPDCDIKFLKLSWSMPTQPTLEVEYAVNPQDAWELWAGVRAEDGAEGTVSVEEVQRFMTGLETHFFRHFKIYLSAGSLVRVSTALGSAHRDGKIKIGSSDYMGTLLTLLTECALVKTPV